MNTTKHELRARMLKLRLEQDPGERSKHNKRLVNELNRILDERMPESVHCFLPMRNEVDITPVMERLLLKGVTVVCPRTLAGRNLEHLVLTDIPQTETGFFGTRHPAGGKIFSGSYDIILVPGLAFDRKGNRLGYGGGYYDTFLKEHPQAYKIGVGFPFQMVDQVPVESHDVPLDEVVF